MFASLTNTKVVNSTNISSNIETAMLPNLNCKDDFVSNDDYESVESEHLKLCEEEKRGGEGGSHDQGHQRKDDRL